jgi:hypothetical protein
MQELIKIKYKENQIHNLHKLKKFTFHRVCQLGLKESSKANFEIVQQDFR